VLEYTRRVPCPAANKDALFREALIWRLAAELATPLSKDPQKAHDRCMRYFDWAIGVAQTSSVNQQQPSLESADADWITGR
jgi:hypothetical protein